MPVQAAEQRTLESYLEKYSEKRQRCDEAKTYSGCGG